MGIDIDEDAPLSPAASLALIAEEQRAVHRRLDLERSVFLLPWGLAWLVGYGVLFLRYGPDERVLVSMPEWLPVAVLNILLVAAAVVTSLAIARATRGVAGESAERGTMYGWSWIVAFAGFAVVGGRFHEFLPEAAFNLLMGSLPVLITGILYMAGGAVWRDRTQFAVGVWLSVINAVGVMAGPGWHSLVISLLGGGAMVTVAASDHLRRRSDSASACP